jgi:hypothetical protein
VTRAFEKILEARTGPEEGVGTQFVLTKSEGSAGILPSKGDEFLVMELTLSSKN